MSDARSRLGRVREIFDAAVKQPEDQRRSFVDAACKGDKALANEVRALLAIDEANAIEPHLAGGGAALLAGELSDDLDLDAEPIPQTVGPFRVLRVLGRGGMGIVYEAEQLEPLRRVALKLVHPGIFGPNAVRRFRREMHVMASLRHPGIVQLLEVGSADTATGTAARPYLAMELVEGCNLRIYAAAGSRTLEEKLGILAMLCDAVHHAHQKGVVHRDLKPENILVQTDSGTTGLTGIASLVGVQPKILDFGVSRLLEDQGSNPAHTMAGQVVGTVPYLSPEQVAGDSEGTDIRSDVYSLGIIAFELFTGKPPFDVSALSIPAALHVISTHSPARLQMACPTIPSDVDTIVHKAIRRDPAQRYQSTADMGADIRRFLAHEPILARRPSLGYVTSRFIRRHRALTGVIGVALLLLIGAVITITLLWSSARNARESAVWLSYRSAMGAASAAIASGDIATARRELETTSPSLRGWEFRHLASRLDQSERVIHANYPAPFSVLPETNTQALFVRSDGVRRVDLSTGTLTADQPDPRLTLWYAAACSAFPGPIFASADVLWRPTPSASDLSPIQPASWPDWPVRYILQARRSGDDGVMAILLGNNERHAVLLSHFHDPTLSRLINLGPSGRVQRMALSPDGSRLFLATTDDDPTPRRLRVIDVRTGSTMCESPELGRPVFSMVVHNDCKVTVVLQDGSLELWDMCSSTARQVAHRTFDHDAAENLTLSSDGLQLASGSRDGLVRLFDAQTLDLQAEQFGNDREIVDVRFLPDGQHVISAARDGAIRIWSRTPPPANPVVLRGHTHLVHPLAYSPLRHQVITGGWDHVVSVFAADNGERLTTTKLDDIVLNLALSGDDRLLATRELGGRVRLLNAATLEPIAEVTEKMIQFDQPAFDRENKLLLLGFDPATASADVWSIERGEVDHVAGSILRTFTSPMLEGQNHLIACTEQRNGVRTTVVYDYDSGGETFATPTTRGAMASLAFAPDGQAFAIPDNQYDIVLYALPGTQESRRFRGHTREVLAMVFSPDGSRLFSADLTGVIRIWDTSSGDQVGELRGHAAHIRRLIVSPDGKLLISGSRDGTARVWRADAAGDYADLHSPLIKP